MRVATVVISVTGDAYHNSVLELMKRGEFSLPAYLENTHTHAHTRAQPGTTK